MSFSSTRTVLTLLIILMTPLAARAEGFSFHASAGLSEPMGDAADVWNTGMTIRGYGYNNLTPTILLGFGLDVNWYGIDSGAYSDDFASLGATSEVTGDMFLYEVGSSLRFQPRDIGERTLGYFGQVGLGYITIKDSGTIKASGSGYSVSSSWDGTDNYFAITLGGGLTFGRLGPARFEVMPLYHVVVDGDSYFTVSGGIVFGG